MLAHSSHSMKVLGPTLPVSWGLFLQGWVGFFQVLWFLFTAQKQMALSGHLVSWIFSRMNKYLDLQVY